MRTQLQKMKLLPVAKLQMKRLLKRLSSKSLYINMIMIDSRYKPFILLVRQAGFEPAAYGFVVRRSIRAELLAHGNVKRRLVF